MCHPAAFKAGGISGLQRPTEAYSAKTLVNNHSGRSATAFAMLIEVRGINRKTCVSLRRNLKPPSTLRTIHRPVISRLTQPPLHHQLGSHPSQRCSFTHFVTPKPFPLLLTRPCFHSSQLTLFCHCRLSFTRNNPHTNPFFFVHVSSTLNHGRDTELQELPAPWQASPRRKSSPRRSHHQHFACTCSATAL